MPKEVSAAEHVNSRPKRSAGLPQGRATSRTAGGPDWLLPLQRAIGNQAVVQLLRAYGARAGPVTVQRGTGSSRLAEAPEEYFTYTQRDVAYRFDWVSDTPAGGEINVFVDDEAQRIGRANFTLENRLLLPPPAVGETYTTEHVLGRQAGIVCHLSGIYNESLTRDGPADIYRGFGDRLMTMVENKARERHAWLMYLEPATSNVRTDPGNNKKVPQDPTTFYTTRHGYSWDATALAHNIQRARSLLAAAGVPAAAQAEPAQKMALSDMGGILVKAL